VSAAIGTLSSVPAAPIVAPISHADISFSAVALKWVRGSSNGDPVTSYDIQYRVVGESKWAQVGSSASGWRATKGKGGPHCAPVSPFLPSAPPPLLLLPPPRLPLPSRSLSHQAVTGLSAVVSGGVREVQTISTRTDPGFPITNGTFTLGYTSQVRLQHACGLMASWGDVHMGVSEPAFGWGGRGMFPHFTAAMRTSAPTPSHVVHPIVDTHTPLQGINDFDPELPSRTRPIPFNASADTVRRELEALPGVGPVEVRRQGPTPLNEYEWKVTWDWGKDPVDIRGDVNNLNPDGLYLGGRWTGQCPRFQPPLHPPTPALTLQLPCHR
jgi:hypothetical protein